MTLILSMAIFSLAMSISPGPVNFLALTAGVNHGVLRALSFVFGATLSFTLLLFLTGFVLGEAYYEFPLIFSGLKFIGCGYLLYLGYRIFSDAGKPEKTNSTATSPSFFSGCLMQWLNPKAWVACLVGCSAFDVYASESNLLTFVSVYFVICFMGIGSWACLGSSIQRWLDSPYYLKRFNQTMGSLLCLLALTLLFG